MHSFKDDFPGIRTTNTDVVVEEVKSSKGYKKNAIVRWRKNKCTYPLFRCAFVAKKDYRKDAITRWKFKKTNCRSALTSNVFFHYNVQETFVILGRMSNVICYDLMHKKRNRTCNAVGNLNDVLVAENLHVLGHESDRNSNVVENLNILVGERNINCNVAENVDVLLDVSGVTNKKSYRKEAISRWKKKREKYDDNSRMRIVNRKGKHLLEQISSASDVLPDVRCCRHCLAFKFYSETANFCCLDGRVVLSSNELPALMKELLISPSEDASLFRTYIRTYNNHFAFTSLGVKSDTSLSKRNKGIYTFRVQGQMYHFINSLLPEEDECKNLQLYFHDTEKELENRSMYSRRLSTDLIAKCVECLKDNPYARFFRNLRDIPNLDKHKIILKTIPGQDQRVFNKPEVSQVAAIWIEGEENGEHGRRSIEVKLHSDCSKSVEYYYGCYDPLQYPLMFPYGELGWHQHIPKNKPGRRGATNDVRAVDTLISPVMAATAEELLDMEENVLGKKQENSKYLSVREYYAYKLQMRPGDKSHLLHFGRLLQQYIVDSYIKLETQRLAFFRSQQDEIRQEFLQGIVDAMASGENEASAIGRRIVLPANFIGGPRNMRRKYVDAMTLVQKFGKPDLFITLTCNPNWPEIKKHMMSHEEAHNRPDLIVRVFHAKLELFKNEILDNCIFGKVVAHTYVIEFQKRGLPHAHFLLILERTFKMYQPHEYDQIVCAEIPDATSNPHLYKMVVKHMLHGPCGVANPTNVCMKDGKCKNSFPKEFCSETTQTDDAYPTYRRRNNGVNVTVKNVKLDNRWVIPYNAYLLCKFDCHINIEICSTIKAVKYIYKYICKGSDKISFAVGSDSNSKCEDEIKQFQSGRWICAPEGAWRIYRFPLSDIKPAVIHLVLHLENYQPVVFKKRQRLSNIVENLVHRKTMLTEFFANNAMDDYAKQLNLTYVQYPDYFTWKADKKTWAPRQTEKSVGRIVIAHPTEGERYYLRILLSKVRCPKSYDDLKTVNGMKVDTFRESALVRGYLIDDNSQQLCLEEASHFHMPYELRRLFATILVYTCPNNPKQLWSSFENMMLEDVLKSSNSSYTNARRSAFQQVNYFLQSMGRQLKEFDVVPHGFCFDDLEDETREIRCEKSIVVSESDLRAIGSLNEKQKFAFDSIMKTVNEKKSGAFFIDGPGGTGKTFLYRALLSKIRSEGGIALATATSGIAASLLPGGRTAHSRFKIPIDLSQGAHCRISKQSSLATLIKSSSLIIWDEAPMAKRSTIEALDDLLQDLMDSTQVFGGKVVVLGGDFRQTLPVITKGTRSQSVAACLTNSPLWNSLCHLRLEQNIRALVDPAFTQFLLNVGEGKESSKDNDLVNIPSQLLVETTNMVDGLDVLIEHVYPNMDEISVNISPNMNRAILTTKNTFVDEINEIMIRRFPGEEVEYNSFDETLDPNDQAHYEDLLHSLTPNGMPPHKLVLKHKAPIILLRNLDPTEGLCNGTRLFCVDFNRNVIRAQIAFGEFAGKEVFIHRIPLQPTTGEQYTVPFKRNQFPVRLCFAMTINKAQGQTLEFVGIYLKEPVFSHGQLYVALSRAKRTENVKIFVKQTSFTDTRKVKNIVYREVLERAKGKT